MKHADILIWYARNAFGLLVCRLVRASAQFVKALVAGHVKLKSFEILTAHALS